MYFTTIICSSAQKQSVMLIVKFCRMMAPLNLMLQWKSRILTWGASASHFLYLQWTLHLLSHLQLLQCLHLVHCLSVLTYQQYQLSALGHLVLRLLALSSLLVLLTMLRQFWMRSHRPSNLGLMRSAYLSAFLTKALSAISFEVQFNFWPGERFL